jgi:hypothetical protein
MNILLRISKTIAWLVSLSITINLVIIATQIIVQRAQNVYFIRIGYPYDFYYFTESLEFHGVSDMLHFIYDGLLTIVVGTIILIFYKWLVGKFDSKNSSTDVLDSEK